MPSTISADEKQWRSESDAHTLAEARVIYDDPERLRLAQEAAKKMAEDQKEKADAMGKVAGSRKMPKETKGSGFTITPPSLRKDVKTGGSAGAGNINKFNVFKKI